MYAKLFFFTMLIFSQWGFASEYPNEVAKTETMSLVTEMREQIDNLGEDKSYTFVPLEISDKDLFLIDQFIIESSSVYSRFGNLHLIQEELPNFLRSVGSHHEQAIQKITEIISRMASQVAEASHKETAWVSVRVSTPNHLYDMPRWHWDGYFYSPYSGFVFKFATVLKGNPTLFYPLSDELREEFHLHDNDREYLSELIDESLIETAKLGQGAFFIIGDKNTAAAHSEPKIDTPRIFFSVLPGDENEIRELCDRWDL